MSTIESLGDVRGKRVLVRSDLNVPLDGTTITDDGRIRASVPTIKALSDAGARVVVTAPASDPLISALVMSAPIQLLAYHVAVVKGADVDQPRNLAKSVTVE